MKLTVYTDGCARTFTTKNGSEYHAGWGLWGFENGNEKRDLWAFGQTGKDKTNNQAELQAAISAVAIATTLKASSIELNIDSTYVKDGCQSYVDRWQKNGWKTAAGAPVKNQDLWKTWLMYKGKAVKNGVNIDYKWVKGHSGIEGNEKADAYALDGATLSAEYSPMQVKRFLHNFGQGEKPAEKETVDKNGKVRAPKVPKKDPLIVGARVLTLTDKELFTHEYKDGTTGSVTYSTKYPASAKVLDREFGLESADAMQCVTISKETDFQLYKIHELTNTLATKDVVLPVVIYWDKLSNSNFRKSMFLNEADLKTSNTGAYRIDKKKDSETKLYIDVDTPLSRIAYYPRRIWDSLEHFEVKYDLLSRYLSDPENFEEDIIDITDEFLVEETDKKGKVKRKINPKIKGKKFLKLSPWYEKEIVLTSLIDMINPVNVGSIASFHPDIRFYLVKHNDNNLSFKFSFMAIAENSAMVMNNPYSNIIYK